MIGLMVRFHVSIATSRLNTRSLVLKTLILGAYSFLLPPIELVINVYRFYRLFNDLKKSKAELKKAMKAFRKREKVKDRYHSQISHFYSILSAPEVHSGQILALNKVRYIFRIPTIRSMLCTFLLMLNVYLFFNLSTYI